MIPQFGKSSGSKRPNPRIIFVTGTDTGVGKTVLTALLLSHLRQSGCPAFALKPFCSGGRADAKLLHALQEGSLTLDEVNPFHFTEAVAPLVAARLHRRKIPLARIVTEIRRIALHLTHSTHLSNSPSLSQPNTPILLLEGAGGLLAPLGEPAFHTRSSLQRNNPIYSAVDLVKELQCEVIVAAPNQLGVMNHTLLTICALQSVGAREVKVVLMDIRRAKPGLQALRNKEVLTEILTRVPVLAIPFIDKRPKSPRSIRTSASRFRDNLEQILLQ